MLRHVYKLSHMFNVMKFRFFVENIYWRHIIFVR
jgi:hypothetical protein